MVASKLFAGLKIVRLICGVVLLAEYYWLLAVLTLLTI
jgi:hypothetical protein